jgi:hypothetical protein
MLMMLALAASANPPWAAPDRSVPLSNPGFEEVGEGAVDAFTRNGLVRPEGATILGLPVGWHVYQWGSPQESRFAVAVQKGSGHSGESGLRAENLEASAKGGVYTHVKLEAGTYELSVWARAPEGQTARVAVYLGTAYSPPMKVGDEWQHLVLQNALGEATDRAEINLQNASGAAGVVWLDDVALRRVPGVRYELTPDTRPERPRTLLFSPMNANYLRETAAQWGERGFRGFLFDGVMASWPSDVWAVDGDPASRGEDDKLLQEVRACNDECRRHGIDSNFVKVAFYDELPDWFDDAAWAKLTENFRQGTRFAKLSGCAGMAIDTEYIAQQYNPGWEGYAKAPRPLPELKAKVRERWRTVIAAMLTEYPQMVLLTLPEGMLYYGELYWDLFTGMLQACADADAPGGLHLMTEGTYHMTAAAALARYPERVDTTIAEECPAPLVAYWRSRCSVALGVWPLGYYRAINDAAGKFVGWAGKKETSGDKVIGSYADKSEWYPVSKFGEQMAGVSTFCPKYNWVYGHGAVFWQWTEPELAKYQQCAHKSASNATLPTVPNLAEYFAVLAKPMTVVRRAEGLPE